MLKSQTSCNIGTLATRSEGLEAVSHFCRQLLEPLTVVEVLDVAQVTEIKRHVISGLGDQDDIPKASLGSWVRQVKAGTLKLGVADGASKVTPEQMEISRLRAEVTRLRMERDIAKKAAAYFAQDVLRGMPGSTK